jgi:hypothetical protein
MAGIEVVNLARAGDAIGGRADFQIPKDPTDFFLILGPTRLPIGVAGGSL